MLCGRSERARPSRVGRTRGNEREGRRGRRGAGIGFPSVAVVRAGALTAEHDVEEKRDQSNRDDQEREVGQPVGPSQDVGELLRAALALQVFPGDFVVVHHVVENAGETETEPLGEVGRPRRLRVGSWGSWARPLQGRFPSRPRTLGAELRRRRQPSPWACRASWARSRFPEARGRNSASSRRT